MGDVKKGEKGVLKLVHPGRYVEIHKKPITAAEVMNKNPRHCVTRPDFFKFPYIVVRPESILYPGQVFYIVPNGTIHKLLNSKSKFEIESTSRRNQPRNLDLDNTPKRNQSRRFSVDSSGSDRKANQGSYLEAWPMMGANRNSYQEFRKSIGEDSTAEDISICRKINSRNKSKKVVSMGTYDTRKCGVQFCEELNGIKSCVKKGSARTDRYQRVTFASPIVTRFE